MTEAIEKRLLSVKELSEYTGLAAWTIYEWVSQKRIPFVKLGRKVAFDLRRIDELIEEGTMGKMPK